MMFSRVYIKAFQKKILTWYELHKRDLPWRGIPDDIPLQDRAYRILVSEVMLQQTQVARVIPKYEAWLEKFPTVEALAEAPATEVLRLWSGLGYNRRALNLQKAARIIIELRKKQDMLSFWPKTMEGLKDLPGVGEYTARAVLCFAFDEQIAVVDTNVRKVILLEILKGSYGTKEPKGIQEIADRLLPKGRARDWNQALMDYAAAMLKKEKILIPKQSRFVGSNRYYRGKLLKVLLAEGPTAVADLGIKLKDDFSAKEDTWLLELIRKMEKDGFVRLDGKKNIPSLLIVRIFSKIF